MRFGVVKAGALTRPPASSTEATESQNRKDNDNHNDDVIGEHEGATSEEEEKQ
jgi:hypothetical protein